MTKEKHESVAVDHERFRSDNKSMEPGSADRADMPARTVVSIGGREVEIMLARSARRALDRRLDMLYVDMELFFSCLVRKRVLFYDDKFPEFSVPVAEAEAKDVGSEAKGARLPEAIFVARANERLMIRFHPVMTNACAMDTFDGPSAPLTDFPIRRPEGFIPRRLFIDYRRGKWRGNFDYGNAG